MRTTDLTRYTWPVTLCSALQPLLLCQQEVRLHLEAPLPLVAPPLVALVLQALVAEPVLALALGFLPATMIAIMMTRMMMARRLRIPSSQTPS